LNPSCDRRAQTSKRIDGARKRQHAKVDLSGTVAADRECHLSHLRVAGKSAVGEAELVGLIDDVHDTARGWRPKPRGSKKQDDRFLLFDPCVTRHNFYACTLVRLPFSESVNRSLEHVVSFTEPNRVPVVSEPIGE
jgi:hypothetical protein